ncbi:Putative Genomic scaffold, msy_sf_1 [Rhizopus microsporus]|nr:Putative Genomic scaffold, msy_sf_1 [Rhizopus microsporus]
MANSGSVPTISLSLQDITSEEWNPQIEWNNSNQNNQNGWNQQYQQPQQQPQQPQSRWSNWNQPQQQPAQWSQSQPAEGSFGTQQSKWASDEPLQNQWNNNNNNNNNGQQWNQKPPEPANNLQIPQVIDLDFGEITKDLQPDSEPNVIRNLFDNPHNVRVTMNDSQLDPNSPLYSVKSFEQLGLNNLLLKGLYAMGFNKPSKIQERALPLMISNPPTNMIAQSQSGTGKTAAFVLAMLSRVDSTIDKPQAICLAPSRELARQICEVTQKMAQFTNIKATAVIKETRRRTINEQIVIGTPGSVMDYMRRRFIDVSDIRVFVLDEADNMLDQDGLGDQSIRIKSMIPANPQTLLFSATFPDHVRKFASKFAPNANEMSLSIHELSVDAIKQFYCDCTSEEHKYEVLCRLYELLTVSQSIIFCRRRETAFEIAKRMQEQGHAIACLHGGMLPEERDKAMDDFRRGEFKVLITTNVIARGIDILQVTLVVNYDIPLDPRGYPDTEAYLHRIGRTGRFGRTGVSIIFVYNEQSWKQMQYLENHFQRPIERIPTDDWEEVERILKPVL